MIDNDTITLKDAANHFGFSVYTLRAEAERGHLTTYKIGKRLYTTPADIRDMVSKCRVDQKGRAFTWIPSGESGSSGTEPASSARAALKQILTEPAGSLGDTLLPNTNRFQVRRP